ncbi:NAD(P)-binding domain-containing protein [Micromonospora sp. PLK6-60]|uniref:NADPH-dependent F420 reductase n=1 Tax=Micromonospora sp. PLK6-60 TaxID=2873383 RepID=UPI001CA68C48|nr:NAD(P)-binding domain-containing protein [Micromonospora sp. PLK6-60]MBY8875927.1 NAD(P)-binding domain-containing protein [Micromonospora sp. PLK6-60]
MRIGILGTGTLATALATGWTRAGHDITIGGRSPERAEVAAKASGAHARPLPEVAADADVVLLSVRWEGVADILAAAGAPGGSLAGKPLIDPTNAVEHGVGVLRTEAGRAAAQHVAELAPGAHVVKALHLFPSTRWTAPESPPVTVAMCGDDRRALETVGSLVRDIGGVPAVVGGLDRARQLEEVAGFVIALAFAGVDPQSAIPAVPSPRGE